VTERINQGNRELMEKFQYEATLTETNETTVNVQESSNETTVTFDREVQIGELSTLTRRLK